MPVKLRQHRPAGGRGAQDPKLGEAPAGPPGEPRPRNGGAGSERGPRAGSGAEGRGCLATGPAAAAPALRPGSGGAAQEGPGWLPVKPFLQPWGAAGDWPGPPKA